MFHTGYLFFPAVEMFVFSSHVLFGDLQQQPVQSRREQCLAEEQKSRVTQHSCTGNHSHRHRHKRILWRKTLFLLVAAFQRIKGQRISHFPLSTFSALIGPSLLLQTAAQPDLWTTVSRWPRMDSSGIVGGRESDSLFPCSLLVELLFFN